MTKICADCKHYKFLHYPIGSDVHCCNSPRNSVNIITGKTEISFCSVNRNYSHLCGPEADWFEPKSVEEQTPEEKKPFWKVWKFW